MAKYKLSKKGNLIVITRRQMSPIPVNQRELQIFSDHFITGFFRPKLVNPKKMEYTAPMGIPLADYAIRRMQIGDLYSILAQIVEVTKKLEQYNMYVFNLVLNTRLIYVKESSGELFFLYEPLVDKGLSTNVFAFICDVVRSIRTNNPELQAECDIILMFLSSPEHYRISEIEGLIRNRYPQIYDKITTVEKGKSGFIRSNRLASTSAGLGNNVSAGLSNQPQAQIQEPQQLGQQQFSQQQFSQPQFSQPQAQEILPQPNMLGAVPIMDGTSLLDSPQDGTTLLVEEDATTLLAPEIRAELIRKSDNSSWTMDGLEMNVGKKDSNQLALTDNRAISRFHAVIRKRNNEFFVEDKGSTNHTFVNGMTIGEKEEVHLQDGDEVKFANEAFLFKIREV